MTQSNAKIKSEFAADLQARLNGRTVIVGVGNPDQGDDAAGCLVAAGIASRENLLALNCEEIPESYTGTIREFAPETIIFIDALHFGGYAGDLVWLEAGSLNDQTHDCHRPSLNAIITYLKMCTTAEIFLIGIQPEKIQYGGNLNPQVAATIRTLISLFGSVPERC
ncbi:hydrogenase maturation protease [candidate division KSB1 bacterium]|nr:hydrogenase maturation protease [candidate division KSB1 bacterium]